MLLSVTPFAWWRLYIFISSVCHYLLRLMFLHSPKLFSVFIIFMMNFWNWNVEINTDATIGVIAWHGIFYGSKFTFTLILSILFRPAYSFQRYVSAISGMRVVRWRWSVVGIYTLIFTSPERSQCIRAAHSCHTIGSKILMIQKYIYPYVYVLLSQTLFQLNWESFRN